MRLNEVQGASTIHQHLNLVVSYAINDTVWAARVPVIAWKLSCTMVASSEGESGVDSGEAGSSKESYIVSPSSFAIIKNRALQQ